MEAFVVTWHELLIVIIAVLVIYVAELLLLMRWSGRPRFMRAKHKVGDGADKNSVEQLRLEVADLRKQTLRLQGELDKLKNVPAALVSPYNLAIQMARQGASANDVATGCGISRGEAELIVALYRKLRI
jgi:hypothetical protein